jgi:hypothetical protein
MKDTGVNQIFSRGGHQLGVGHKERVNEGKHGRCILYSYTKIERRMKPVKIVLRRGGGE